MKSDNNFQKWIRFTTSFSVGKHLAKFSSNLKSVYSNPKKTAIKLRFLNYLKSCYILLGGCTYKANFLKNIKLTSGIANTRYLKLSLSQTFSSVPSALSVNALIISFGISNPAISNFYYVELFSRPLQHFLVLFSIRYLESFHFTHSIIERMRWSTLMKSFFSYFNKTTYRSNEILTSKV